MDSGPRALFTGRFLTHTSCCVLVLVLNELDVALLLCIFFFTSPALLIFYGLPLHCLPAIPLPLNHGTCFLFNYQRRQHDTVEGRTVNTLTATLDYACDI